MSTITRKSYACSCGTTKSYWAPKCPSCRAWNTMREVSGDNDEDDDEENAPAALVDVQADEIETIDSGIEEFDRVLSSAGGAALGGVYLMAGPPGIGKSTLLMQAIAAFAGHGEACLYVSGEESRAQTANRARRLLEEEIPEDLLLLSETDLPAILRHIEKIKPLALVIDSVQTIGTAAIESEVGGVLQVRDVARRIGEVAKRLKIATFLVGHVTKDGDLAGPKTLEHLVDAVLEFSGEKGQVLRSLRAQKNRFGSTTPIGIFRMVETGLEPVPNPSELFLAERALDTPGSMVAAVYENNRSMLMEIQALVGVGTNSTPRRTSHGIDSQRLAMILTVLDKIDSKPSVNLTRHDIFVNIAGGVSVKETGIDLPLALAIHSSSEGMAIDAGFAAFGEIGLAGEIRSVDSPEARLEEIESMGFRTVLVPPSVKIRSKKLEIVTCSTLEEAIGRKRSRKSMLRAEKTAKRMRK